MLLVSDNAKIEIIVSYKETEKGIVFEDAPESLKETFVFKKKNWENHKSIMSSSVIMNASGEASVDLFKLMDMSIKTLLVDWTLKDDKGDKIPVTIENINRLPSSLVQHIFEKVKAIDGSFLS